MEDKVVKHIEENNLFSKEDKLIVAISGGCDSVALAMILHRTGYSISLAHCNFNLRNSESDKDQLFVESLAKSIGVLFYSKSFDTLKYVKEKKVSIQMAARDLRYEWLNSLLIETNSKFIVVGHHLDDSQETLFINLIRGTGIKGLLGINNINGKIIRPLLPFRKSDIISYLNKINQDYREDISNSDIKYIRNNIRKNLMPIIYSINPSYDKTFVDELSHLSEVYEVYNKVISQDVKEIVDYKKNGLIILKEDLLNTSHPKSVLRHAVSPYGFNKVDHIYQALFSESGKRFYSNTSEILIDRSKIILRKLMPESTNKFISINDKQILFPINLSFLVSDNLAYVDNHSIAYLDYDLLEFPLKIMKWKDGDYFYPLGMQKKKKLSDFFIDNKLSLFDKEDVWLLYSGNNIVWVVGYRIDDRFKLTKDSKKAYIAEYKKAGE
tara:strand:+ start:2381 stop:3697 length:1317 start_codon:yes stop_codon:yes gene_type:complete